MYSFTLDGSIGKDKELYLVVRILGKWRDCRTLGKERTSQDSLISSRKGDQKNYEFESEEL